jgi:hypothetical protein
MVERNACLQLLPNLGVNIYFKFLIILFQVCKNVICFDLTRIQFNHNFGEITSHAPY